MRGYCQEIESFHLEGTANSDILELVADQSTGYIYVFKNGYLKFTYDTNYQVYKFVDESEIGEYQYWLTSDPKPNGVALVLSRCEKTTQRNCIVLFFSETIPTVNKAYLAFDSETRVLNIIVDGFVIFQVAIP